MSDIGAIPVTMSSDDDAAIEKHYISAEQLLDDSFRLGVKILESGFPAPLHRWHLARWCAGRHHGAGVAGFFRHPHGPHFHPDVVLYKGIDERESHIRVHGLQYVIDNVDADEGLLIVDDVYDTGLSIEAVIADLRKRARRNTPTEIRIATAYFKPGNNRTDRVPDYFIHESDSWLVFPHELNGLSREEILKRKPGIEAIVDKFA